VHGVTPSARKRAKLVCQTSIRRLGNTIRLFTISLTAVNTSCGPTARIEWGEESDLTADDLVKPPDAKSERIAEVRDRAQEFLKSTLADGPLSWEAITERGQAVGFAEGTLRKARSEVGLVKEYRGKSRCLWRLAEFGELPELPGQD
jgi:hypothetical protein